MRGKAWIRETPNALFVGSVLGSATAVVALGAAALPDVGAVALVAVFIPGAVCGRVLVMAA